MGRRVGSDYFLPQRWVNKPSKSRCAGLHCVACSEVLVAEDTCTGGCAVARKKPIVQTRVLIAVVAFPSPAQVPAETEAEPAEEEAEAVSLQVGRSIAHKEPSPKPASTYLLPGDTTFTSKPTGSCTVSAADRSPSGAVVCSLVVPAPRSPMFPGPLPQPTTTTAIRKMPLKRLEPRTGKEVAGILLQNYDTEITEVAFGAGSVWVSNSTYLPGPVYGKQPNDVVFRIDPRTNRVVDRIPVYTASGLAFGHGSVWVASASYGTVSRIVPETDEVVAKIEVGRGAVDVTTDESSGAVWVAGLHLPPTPGAHSEHNKLSRIDPATNRVVAEIPIRASSPDGGVDNVAVGEGAVWAQSTGTLLKVDPATNEVTATVPLGDYSSHLVVYGGAVWAMVQAGVFLRLARVDPRTEQVVASEDIGPISKGGYGRLATGGGYVWFSSGGGLARVAP
jgi:DNA-binding beta-propeller fold protein YncE